MTDGRSEDASALRRVVGVPGAVLLGLGSILGTGIFVSIGLAAGIAGESVVAAVLLAAVIATFNGLSSAQLAAAHPVSGGTYEYGYRWLGPWLGFSAGFMFVCAKTASAATAALGVAGYVLRLLEVGSPVLAIVVGLGVTAALTIVVAGGMTRSSRTNAAFVAITVTALVVFVVAGGVGGVGGVGIGTEGGGRDLLEGAFSAAPRSILHATALMFVAYTGYGRVATLGEEIREPARNIPRAIVATLAISAALYVAVTFVAVGTVGPAELARATLRSAAPLQAASARLGGAWLPAMISIGAITAMVGVVLNLLLGISRVLLAMARRGDLPRGLAKVKSGSPTAAVILTGLLIAAIVSLGSVQTTWTFSAFTVLVYYGLTNLAALRLSPTERRVPRLVPALGLASCLSVAAFVEPEIWAAGLTLLALGLTARRLLRHEDGTRKN